jgi:hypothetical protein
VPSIRQVGLAGAMRQLALLSHMLVFACATACASYSGSSLTAKWRGRDVNELIVRLGAPDVDTIRGEHRAYEWYRLGPCAIKAETTLERRITLLKAEGSYSGCSAYWRDRE